MYDDCSGSACDDKPVAPRSETSNSLLSRLHVSCSLTAAAADDTVVGDDDSKLSAAVDDSRAMKSTLEAVAVVAFLAEVDSHCYSNGDYVAVGNAAAVFAAGAADLW